MSQGYQQCWEWASGRLSQSKSKKLNAQWKYFVLDGGIAIIFCKQRGLGFQIGNRLDGAEEGDEMSTTMMSFLISLFVSDLVVSTSCSAK